MLVTELDIWRSAYAVLKITANMQEIIAAMRADSFLEKGDLDGNRVWMRVLARVRELRREKSPGDEVLN